MATPSLAQLRVPAGMVLAGADTIAPNATNGEVVRRLVSAVRETVLLGEGLEGAWREVPESSYAVIGGGEDQIGPFSPRP